MANRREFFQLFKKPITQIQESSHRVVRPPYGLSESLFQSECITCEAKACVVQCEEKIVIIGADLTPILNLTKGGCTFCEACMNACEDSGHQVLNQHHLKYAKKINAEFRISFQSCMAHHGVICFSCKEPCIEDAILFNGLFNPVIDMDLCTGCGFCLQRCPSKAISYFALPMQEMTKELS